VAGAAVCLGLWPAAAAAALDDGTGPLFGPSRPRFAADLTSSLAPDGRTRVRIEIEVPYAECQFVRVPAGFGAALEFVVALERDGRPIAGDAWERRFVVATFDETRDGELRFAVEREFRVSAGEYRWRVRVQDRNGGGTAEALREVELRGLGGSTLGLGDLLFGECAAGDSAEAFRRLASRRYAGDLQQVCVQGTVFDLAAADSARRYRIHYRVRDEAGGEFARGDTTLPAGQRTFVLHPAVHHLFLGPYRLEVEVAEGDRRYESESTFEIESTNAPRGGQWAMMIEVLGYVTSSGDLEPLRRARTDEERAAAWDEFWRRRDPRPETPRNEALLDLMRRVREANREFQALEPGWRTDRGRIYIRYGNPDQIDDHQGTADSPPVQIWHYYSRNLRFVFADRTGFGRYELVSQGEM
jgi:GWxTD domain-containing protein